VTLQFTYIALLYYCVKIIFKMLLILTHVDEHSDV